MRCLGYSDVNLMAGWWKILFLWQTAVGEFSFHRFRVLMLVYYDFLIYDFPVWTPLKDVWIVTYSCKSAFHPPPPRFWSFSLGGEKKYKSKVDIGGFVGDYPERKGDSHFCLVPAGTSPWTNHLYESFYAGCIPVILSDEYELAFMNDLPWEKFSIKWPESLVCDDDECNTSSLYEYLRALAEEHQKTLAYETGTGTPQLFTLIGIPQIKAAVPMPCCTIITSQVFGWTTWLSTKSASILELRTCI